MVQTLYIRDQILLVVNVNVADVRNNVGNTTEQRNPVAR